ncbi:MAG: sugar ABC transporter ATP-binding protein [Clostridiales Family XIII bacterium]|jgi:methyl-galactoside transport system ATP-binding protein/inositol transport system ATP-binding protein|nr:sugar ABC transporter ATP-binding protein [Clostridiales Family XIII bacterium]
MEYVLEMQGIVKSFPGVKALKGVDLRVRPGTVHGLMGENGAGKSTLMKCLIGMYTANEGSITYKGEQVSFNNVREALEAGISMVHQELSPVPERTVMENVWLGREPMRPGGIFVDHKKMLQDTIDLFARINVNLDPKEKMGNLSVAKMQMVEISKAVSHDASIVIMDEPTSALTATEAEDLFRIINDLKSKGVSLIYISHKMDEIFGICDDLTIYRDGEYVDSRNTKDIDQEELIQLMVGRKLTAMFPKLSFEIGPPIFKVEGLSSGKLFQDVSFELRKGEILGFAGLVGAGRTEIVETIFGMHPITAGKIYKDGVEIKINSPRDAIHNKIGLLTEDRRGNGIFGMLSVADNTIIANLDHYGLPLNHKKIRSDAQEYVEKLNVKTPSLAQEIKNLSGGNQQKVLVARWLLTDPDILIVDEPTRGIDVGAKSEIHSLITRLAAEGKSIIMISSEMPEVLGMSDRILVMHEGHMTGIIDRADATQELVMQYATASV